MDCALIAQLTAWPCRPVEGTGGEQGLVIAPPVAFWDGSVVPLYVFQRGAQVEITDDGCLLEHLEGSGFKIAGDRRRRKGLDEAIARWSVGFGDELQVFCDKADFSYGLHRLTGALFAAANWEYTNSGKGLDASLLIAEVEMYLKALHPATDIDHDVSLIGLSGRTQIFPLKVGPTYYDAVGTNATSSAALTKRLVDVRLLRENAGVPITVVLEDRVSTKRAHADSQIYSQFAHVTRMSALQEQAMKALRQQ